jgi:hypothetical protein
LQLKERTSPRRLPREGTRKKVKVQRKKDMSKVKCFVCHKFGHYVGQCPNMKKKQVAASTNVEEFTHRFEKEYLLLVCLSSRASSFNIYGTLTVVPLAI